MKVLLVHLIVEEEMVDIPDKCPRCNHDLTKPRSVQAWELEGRGRIGSLEEPAHNPDSDAFDVDDHAEVLSSDNFISYQDYYCADCGQVLLQGRQTHRKVNKGEADGKVTST